MLQAQRTILSQQIQANVQAPLQAAQQAEQARALEAQRQQRRDEANREAIEAAARIATAASTPTEQQRLDALKVPPASNSPATGRSGPQREFDGGSKEKEEGPKTPNHPPLQQASFTSAVVTLLLGVERATLEEVQQRELLRNSFRLLGRGLFESSARYTEASARSTATAATTQRDQARDLSAPALGTQNALSALSANSDSLRHEVNLARLEYILQNPATRAYPKAKALLEQAALNLRNLVETDRRNLAAANQRQGQTGALDLRVVPGAARLGIDLSNAYFGPGIPLNSPGRPEGMQLARAA